MATVENAGPVKPTPLSSSSVRRMSVSWSGASITIMGTYLFQTFGFTLHFTLYTHPPYTHLPCTRHPTLHTLHPTPLHPPPHVSWSGSSITIMGTYMEKGIQTPMAQGWSTKIISMIEWIRTIRLSMKNTVNREHHHHCHVPASGFRVQGSACGVWGVGLRIQGA